MSEFRDFDAEQAELAGEGVAFRLGGQDFRTKPFLPYGVLGRYIAGFAMEGRDEDALTRLFFAEVLPDEQVPVMAGVLDQSYSPVSEATVAAVFKHIIAGITALPTTRPLNSSAGASDTTPDSTAAVSENSPEFMAAVAQMDLARHARSA